MSDIDDIAPIDWQGFGHFVLLALRVGLIIIAVVATGLGFSDLYDARQGGSTEILAAMRISGAVLVGTGLCSLAFICYQFPPSFRSHDDSHPRV